MPDPPAPAIDAQTWFQAIRESLDELGRDVLGLEQDARELESLAETSLPVRGSYVSLLDGDVSALIGVRGTSEDAKRLAQFMLGMEPDEMPEHEEVLDCLSETVNIVGGVIKVKLDMPSLRLGLPMVVSGRVAPSNHHEAASRALDFGEFQIEALLLVRRRNPRLAALRRSA